MTLRPTTVIGGPLRRSPEQRRRFDTIGAILFATTIVVAGLGVAARPSEALTRRTVRTALDTSGHLWAETDVSGRNVRLWGLAPSQELAKEAERIARETMCETRLGSRRCAVIVSNDFGSTGFAWPELIGTVDRGVLTVSGVVPDVATRDVVRSFGERVKGDLIRKIVDETTTAGLAAPAGVDATVGRLIELASLCESGGVRLSRGVLSVDCQVPAHHEAALRGLSGQILPAGVLGEINVTATAVAEEDKP